MTNSGALKRTNHYLPQAHRSTILGAFASHVYAEKTQQLVSHRILQRKTRFFAQKTTAAVPASQRAKAPIHHTAQKRSL